MNIRYLNDEKQSGQIQYDPKIHKFSSLWWGSEVDTKRFDFSGKMGYVNPQIPYQSLGFQFAYSDHNQNSYFGNKIYYIKHEVE